LILILTFATENDRDKFEFIYEEYKNLLFKKAYDILKDHMLAEDAVSEAYLRIYRNLHKIEDKNSGKCIAFCVTIVKNVALTMYQKRTRDEVSFLETDIEDESEMETLVIDKIGADRIYSIINSLDEDSKNIFILKYSYGMSHKEIADTTGITENNVTVKLFRAKKKLAGILVKEGIADDQQ